MTGHAAALGVCVWVNKAVAWWRVEGVERERLRSERRHEGSEWRRPVVVSWAWI